MLKLKELERWKNDCCCNEEAENGMRDCDAAEARTRIRTEYEVSRVTTSSPSVPRSRIGLAPTYTPIRPTVSCESVRVAFHAGRSFVPDASRL